MPVKNEKVSIEDFIEANRFKDLLLATKKYEDLFWSKEAIVSCVLSLCTTYLMFLMTESSDFIENISNILSILIGGMFGLLGFIIGGLALIVGSIGFEIIKKINDLEKFNSLLSIIFMFYFVGAINGLAIVLLFFSYLTISLPLPFNLNIFLIATLFVSYICYFTLIYSVMLLGTCIRLMLLNYYYSNKIQAENNDSK